MLGSFGEGYYPDLIPFLFCRFLWRVDVLGVSEEHRHWGRMGSCSCPGDRMKGVMEKERSGKNLGCWGCGTRVVN